MNIFYTLVAKNMKTNRDILSDINIYGSRFHSSYEKAIRELNKHPEASKELKIVRITIESEKEI